MTSPVQTRWRRMEHSDCWSPNLTSVSIIPTWPGLSAAAPGKLRLQPLGNSFPENTTDTDWTLEATNEQAALHRAELLHKQKRKNNTLRLLERFMCWIYVPAQSLCTVTVLSSGWGCQVWDQAAFYRDQNHSLYLPTGSSWMLLGGTGETVPAWKSLKKKTNRSDLWSVFTSRLNEWKMWLSSSWSLHSDERRCFKLQKLLTLFNRCVASKLSWTKLCRL